MTKNLGSTARKIKNEKGILKALLTGEKNVGTLQKIIGVSPQTIAVRLSDLEKRGLIKLIFHDNRREKIYKLTSKGLKLLNELDIETKSKVFTAHIFSDIHTFFWLELLFDSRMSDEAFIEAFEVFKRVYNSTDSIHRYDQMTKLYEDCMALRGLEKIPPLNSALPLRKEFFEFLSNQIGEAVLYISLKYSEEKKPETPSLLAALPLLLCSQIEAMADVGDQRKERLETIKNQFKKNISRWAVYEEYFKASQNITSVENYNKTVSAFARIPDLPLLELMGEDFHTEGIKTLKSLKPFKPDKQ